MKVESVVESVRLGAAEVQVAISGASLLPTASGAGACCCCCCSCCVKVK